MKLTAQVINSYLLGQAMAEFANATIEPGSKDLDQFRILVTAMSHTKFLPIRKPGVREEE